MYYGQRTTFLDFFLLLLYVDLGDYMEALGLEEQALLPSE